MFEKIKNRKGQVGGINIQTGIIIILVMVIAGAWYFNIGPFAEGDTTVDVGYIMDNGEIKYINDKEMEPFYAPHPATPDSPESYLEHDGTRVNGFVGTLNVKAETEESGQLVNLRIDWKIVVPEGDITTPIKSGQVDKDIDSGEKVKVLTNKVYANTLFEYMGPDDQVDVKFVYNVEAMHSQKTDSVEVSGAISAKYVVEKSTLEITADVGTAPTMIFEDS